MSDITLFNDIEMETTADTCRHCQHRQRIQCGGRVIQYCGVRGSNRTANGLLKIKVTMPACSQFKQEKKQ